MTAPDKWLDAAALDLLHRERWHGWSDATKQELIAQARAALAMRDELAESDRTRDMLASICKRTAVALEGPEPDMGLHDWSDLPEVARKVVDELAELSNERDRLLASESEEHRRRVRAESELAECQQKHAACDDCLDNTKAELEQLRGDFGIRMNQVALMREDLADLRAKLAQAQTDIDGWRHGFKCDFCAESEKKLAHDHEEWEITLIHRMERIKELEAKLAKVVERCGCAEIAVTQRELALAASQARERELRELLSGAFLAHFQHYTVKDRERIKAALARPSDDSALREFGHRVSEATFDEVMAASTREQAVGTISPQMIVSRLLGGGK